MTAKTVSEPGAAIGLSELDVLTLTLWHEAGGEGRKGMLAVGCVIRNRVAWGKWGATFRAVCLARWQFSCWLPQGGAANYGALVQHADAIRRGDRPKRLEIARTVALAVLGDATDATGGATHYYAPAAMVPPGRVPDWARGVSPTATIGAHIFYDLRPIERPGVTT